MPDLDLRRLARSAAVSQIRLQRQINESMPDALIQGERAIFEQRKATLHDAVARARVRGQLPERDELLAAIILTEEADCTEDEAEAGVAAALLLGALDAE